MSKPPIRDALHRLEAAFSPGAGADAPVEETPGSALDPALRAAAVRIAEALLFAGGAPMTAETLASRLPDGADVHDVLATLQKAYEGRGVQLVEAGGGWRFQSAPDLAQHFAETRAQPRRLPKAAMETLAVIAYHQPVTRAEIEEIRGVSLSRGSLDLLLELDWVKPRGRRRTPGRPLTFGTTQTFLSHFGLTSLDALPGKADLKAAGYVESRIDPAFDVPRPDDALAPDEDPLEESFGGKVDDAAFYVDYSGDDEGGR
jgi:segregation and condensation protein B